MTRFLLLFSTEKAMTSLLIHDLVSKKHFFTLNRTTDFGSVDYKTHSNTNND